MKIQHRPHHWIAVAIALAVFLLTLSEVHGQSTGAAAFEGRPAMAGAQGGLGAQAGPPQGGIGVQGSDTAQRSIDRRRPSALDEMAQARRDTADVAAAENTDMTLRRDRDNVKPGRDQSIAKDQRSATRKVKKAAKRTITRGRHGVSEFDTAGTASAR